MIEIIERYAALIEGQKAILDEYEADMFRKVMLCRCHGGQHGK